jgi:hypothetical protein
VPCYGCQRYLKFKSQRTELNRQTYRDRKMNVKTDKTKLYDGKLKKYTDIRRIYNYFCQQNKGYYSSVFTETVQAQEGGIMIEGKYAGDPTFYYYAVGM